MTKFLCSYNFRGDRYSLEIIADDIDEARLRLRAIGVTGTVDGEEITKIDVVNKLGKFFPWLQK